MGFRGSINPPKYCIFVYLFNFFPIQRDGSFKHIHNKVKHHDLNGGSIEKPIGDFSMKTYIELIDVKVLDNNDHRELGSRATYFRKHVTSKCMVSGCHGVDSSSSVQFSCSVVSDSVTPWTEAHQASLSITNSRSLLKLTSIESVMSSNHLVLCCPLSYYLQSFPASGSFPVSHFFALEFQLQHPSFQ